MASDHRADFEQRVMALVRSELRQCDEAYRDGYGIGRFAIVYEVLFAPGEEPEPWAHSWHDGSGIEFGFSDSSWWTEIGMLREALDKVEDARSNYRWDQRYPKDDDDDDEVEDEGDEPTA